MASRSNPNRLLDCLLGTSLLFEKNEDEGFNFQGRVSYPDHFQAEVNNSHLHDCLYTASGQVLSNQLQNSNIISFLSEVLSASPGDILIFS